MANFAFSVPALGAKFIDYRQTIPGDSFNWSWIRPLASVRYLVVHHTAGPDAQTPDEIANYHIQHNGWGGVGYHFIISKTGIVYYVGDIYTARASVQNLNDKIIGICLVGNFMSGKRPTTDQIQSAHGLCAQLLFETPALPNIDGWEDVVGHSQLNQTVCPGDGWGQWRNDIVTVPVVVDSSAAKLLQAKQLARQIVDL